jgi:glycosyltransferase involved in cell wall biosynthesis
MFCSTVIPTIARPTLARAVKSVLAQTFSKGNIEIIVVNDSGRPLPEADWQAEERVRVIDTNRRERSFARNSGAAIAKGRYLHFLDDDDWVYPDAIQSIWELAQESQADWLYGSSQLVDRQGQPLIELHHGMNGNCFVHIMSGEWIPLQASFIKAEAFFAIGGFTPLLHATQDVDLCRRIALRGNLAGTSKIVACIGMGSEGSSTDYERAPLYSRWAREKILNEPGVFSRLRDSASDSYWQGRIARIFFTSVIWNVQQRKGFTGASRFMYGMGALVLAGLHLLDPNYWQAFKGRYVSKTFLQGFKAASRELDSLPL